MGNDRFSKRETLKMILEGKLHPKNAVFGATGDQGDGGNWEIHKKEYYQQFRTWEECEASSISEWDEFGYRLGRLIEILEMPNMEKILEFARAGGVVTHEMYKGVECKTLEQFLAYRRQQFDQAKIEMQ